MNRVHTHCLAMTKFPLKRVLLWLGHQYNHIQAFTNYQFKKSFRIKSLLFS